MRDELFDYYKRELDFLRQMGAEYARRHPDDAANLQLSEKTCADPHVERLIEACALLTGRIQLKLNDEFPEIGAALLNVLYPHYLAPIPSMSIMQFSLPAQSSNLKTGQVVERGVRLQSPPVKGTATKCQFRTCYPCVLWPIEVEAAVLRSDDPPDSQTGRWREAAIRLSLRCAQQTPLAQLALGGVEPPPPIESLRFFINGEPSLSYPLYEMIFNHATRVELRPTGAGSQPAPVNLPASCLKPVGFGADEGMLPYTARSFVGYRVLTEYFVFLEKFLFFDVTGLDAAAAAGFGDEFELVIHLREVTPPSGTVNQKTFLLGCTPIVNLFEKSTEPISLTQEKAEYPVTPELSKQATTEVYSVNAVEVTGGGATETRQFQPFYSLRHAFGDEPDAAFWYALRRPSASDGVPGTEVSLMFVDRRFNPRGVANQRVIVKTTCTNRNLPFGLSEDRMDIIGPQVLWRARCVKKPTSAVWPELRRGAHWRLLSHLTLNYLSLGDVERNGSPEALQEILRLYDFSEALGEQIAGIKSVRSEPAASRLAGAPVGAGYVRGLQTTVEFDEREYPGGSVFLFAAVLERFLGLYVSVNSFNRLVARTRQGELKQWLPRAGEQTLL